MRSARCAAANRSPFTRRRSLTQCTTASRSHFTRRRLKTRCTSTRESQSGGRPGPCDARSTGISRICPILPGRSQKPHHQARSSASLAPAMGHADPSTDVFVLGVSGDRFNGSILAEVPPRLTILNRSARQSAQLACDSLQNSQNSFLKALSGRLEHRHLWF